MANGLTYAPQQQRPLTTQPAPPVRPPRTNGLAQMTAQFMPQQRRANGMDAFVDSFQRVIAPQDAQARDQRMDQAKKQKLEQGLAYVQQMRQMQPAERFQFAQAGAQKFGLDGSAFGEDGFTDQALDQSIAALSAELGLSPESPEFQFLQGPRGEVSLGNRRTGEVTQKIAGAPEKAEPPPLNNGMEWDGEKWVENPAAIAAYRKMHPQNAGGSKRTINLTPEEVEARGYPKGTVVQRDEEGNELVRSRPSTQQTGQPTEGERKFALYAASAKNALKIVDSMESIGAGGTNYDRGGELNPFSENSRKYDQAMGMFIDSWLRAMTGAAATKDEVALYSRQWSPQFGDTPEVRQQKAAARRNAIQQLEAAAARGMAGQRAATAQPQAAPQQPGGIIGAVTRGVQGAPQSPEGQQPDVDFDAQIEQLLDEALAGDDEGETGGGLSDEEREELEMLRRELGQ